MQAEANFFIDRLLARPEWGHGRRSKSKRFRPPKREYTIYTVVLPTYIYCMIILNSYIFFTSRCIPHICS